MLQLPQAKGIYDAINAKPYGERQWQVTLILVAGNRRIKIPKVVSRTAIGDFEKNYAEEDYLRFQIGQTTYRDTIYPFKDDLRAEITKTLLDGSGNVLPGGRVIKTGYQCFLVNPPNVDMSRPSKAVDNPQLLEMAGMMNLTVQLLEDKLSVMRMVDVSGVYKKTTLSSLLTTLMCSDLNENTDTTSLASDAYKGVRGIDIVPMDNTTVYNNVIIPTGTRLTTLVRKLQEMKGLYNTKVNRFYKHGRWFIYPLYNVKRFSKAKRKLNIINVAPDELVTPTKTFMINQGEVFILATGNTTMADMSNTKYLDEGNAIRFTKASTLMTSAVTTSGNKTKPNTDNAHKAVAIEAKSTGLNNARMASGGVTDNYHRELSRVSDSKISYVQVKWANSDPDAIVPGMAACLWIEQAGVVVKRYGTVLGIRTETTPDTALHSDNAFFNHSSLVLAIEK